MTFAPLGSSPLPDRAIQNQFNGKKKGRTMHPLIQLKTTSPLFITLALLCFGFLPGAQAVVPAPDGGYGPPDYGTGNTAEGEEALLNLSSGGYNTAAGFRTLFTNTTGNFNTPSVLGRCLRTPERNIRPQAPARF